MEKLKQGKTMTYAVAINSSGQATIPKAIRELLGVVPGENRLTFDVVKGKVILGREASRREQLMASLAKIDANMAAAKKRDPRIAEAMERYKGMTFDEVREAYDATPEGKQEFKEKYGFEI